MPPHTLYREPFFGGGAVLFRKPCEGIGEAVNDLSQRLAHFWHVLSDRRLAADFIRSANMTPLSQQRWLDACEATRGNGPWCRLPVDDALDFFIRYRQSRQGLGTNYTTPTTRTRRGMNEQVSAWLSAVEGLPEAHERLIRVEICCMDAKEFIRRYDAPDALFYCDPSYLHYDEDGTPIRVTTKDYEHEMTLEQHIELLECLSRIKGKFLLSGYPSDLYEAWRAENGYRVVTKEIDNKASGAKSKAKKTECLWMNH